MSSSALLKIKGLADPSRAALSLIRGLLPDPLESISEWADKHVVLPKGTPEPGQWRTSRTPFLADIMDCLSPFPIKPENRNKKEVVFMKPAQVGGTEVGKNWIGHTIHRSPTNMMVVEPTVDVAKKFSKQKLAPMIANTPVLRGRVRDAKERHSGNTILEKEFDGGVIVITGANSGPGLRFMSVRRLFLDEVDAYPHDVDGEGHPADVAKARGDAYGDFKAYLASTPLDETTSVIEPAYEESDRRLFSVPCPFCDYALFLTWAGLVWPKGEPEKAAYECDNCKKMIKEHYKTRMLDQGIWIARNPEITDIAGFHINGLYQPYGWKNTWPSLAKRWTRIVHRRDMKARKTFTNTVLAQTWKEEKEEIEKGSLMARRESYPAPVPSGALILVGLADVQGDRIKAEVFGLGVGEEEWSIDYRVLIGSPAQQDVWDQLDRFFLETFTHESGIGMKVVAVGIDTGGHHTKEAYAFVKGTPKSRRRYRCFALKGANSHGAPLVKGPTKSNIGRVNLYLIGTVAAKDTIFANLQMEEYGPGYMHYPDDPKYDDDYFSELTAEVRMNKYDKGVLVGHYYKKIRPRNEELDLRVYRMGVTAILNPDWDKISEGIKKKTSAVQKEEAAPVIDQPEPPSPPWPGKGGGDWGKPRGGGWMNGWRR